MSRRRQERSMCRWIAYRGETIPLEQYVTAPAHSLVVQSQRALESTAATITATTINAAYSLNRGDKLGSLEPGKIADFVIHDTGDYRELAYFFGVNHAWQVYASGQRV